MEKLVKRLLKSAVGISLALAFLVCLMPSMRANAAVAVVSAPKDVKQTISTLNGFQVTWTKVTGATTYFYSLSSDKTTWGTEANTNGANSITLTNTSWTAGTSYYLRVRAFNGTTYSDYTTIDVATAPKAPTTLYQTAGDNGSVTLTWSAVTGATGYMIRIGASPSSQKDIAVVKTNSCAVKGLTADSAYCVAVIPVRSTASGFSASYYNVSTEDNYSFAYATTTAGAVKGLKLGAWEVNSNILNLTWTNAAKYESGYQIEIYKADGTTLLGTTNVIGRKTSSRYIPTSIVKKIGSAAFQYRIRTYTYFAGTKSYGAWSNMAVAVPQAKVTASKVSNTSVKLSWTKVTGAKSYTIYRATKEGGKYKKIATTTKRSYTMKDLATYDDYYVYVKANKVKVAGKYRNSSSLSEQNDIRIFIQKYSNDCYE